MDSTRIDDPRDGVDLAAAEFAAVTDDLRIDYPAEEELLAACEYALGWFEKWEEHADHDHDFGGEYRVMKRLRRAIKEAREA